MNPATELPSGFVLDAPAIISFKFPGNRYGSLAVVYSPETEVDRRGWLLPPLRRALTMPHSSFAPSLSRLLVALPALRRRRNNTAHG